MAEMEVPSYQMEVHLVCTLPQTIMDVIKKGPWKQGVVHFHVCWLKGIYIFLYYS